MNNIKNANGLLRLIQEEKIIIYGTGFVAERFLRILERNNLAERIQCFVTTDSNENEYKGYSLYSIDSLPQDLRGLCVCIAVHESNLKQIEETLDKRGIRRRVWIYPYIHDLWYGEPIETNKQVPVSKIIAKCKDDYRIPIRVLAIEQYYEKNDVGYGIYVKSQTIHSTPETAEVRLNKFIELITSWDRVGYDNTQHLKITTHNEIFDGVHRLSLAYYHGLCEILCDVYNESNAEDYTNSEIRLTKEAIAKAGLSEEERRLLDRVLDKLN